MKTVICIGELLIDWFPYENNQGLSNADLLQKRAGGAPANVAVIVSALGGKSSLMAHVGIDPFGKWLRQMVAAYEVDVSHVKMVDAAITTMAYVSRLPGGERDFVFVYGADQTWKWPESANALFGEKPIVHFGAATLQVHEVVRERYMQAMERCAELGCLISFDPNFRADLWRDRIAEWRTWVGQALQLAHVVKMSDEELFLFTENPSLDEAMNALRLKTDAIGWITCGEDGAHAILKNQIVHVPVSPHVNESNALDAIVDTTGAGDAFIGAMLFQLAQAMESGDDPQNVRDHQLQNELLQRVWLTKANRVAGWICRQVGAMPNSVILEMMRRG